MGKTTKRPKKMLVFHSAYTFDYLKEYKLEVFVKSRDAADFFEEILTVSPIASLQYKKLDPRNFSKPDIFNLDDKDTILEGKIARYQFLSRFKKVNFLIAQVSLVTMLIRKGGLSCVQLIRAEDPRFNGLYGYIFSRILRKPFVVGVWGNPGRLRKLNQKPNMPGLFRSLRVEEQLEKFILRRADMVLAQNRENLNYAVEAGVRDDRTCLTPLGIGIDKCHFLEPNHRRDVGVDFEAWEAKSSFNIVCISRLESLKMVDHAIRAVCVLRENGLQFKLFLIGDGRERQNLETLARELGISDCVIFAGNRDQEWIAGAMNFVDLNLVPLCGRSLLEASLSGVPAVAYDVDWHDEIVVDNLTGKLVENLQFRKLGEAVLELYLDTSKRNQMRNFMKSHAYELASPELIAKQQFRIYENLIASKSNLQ
jgi:glycosyltransferase involved in cell wall biosynthesis